MMRYLGFLFLFSIVATWPMFIQLWRFGAFQTFNDSYTYLAHAQWLQSHNFREIPQAADFHPLWSQVLLYQVHSLRMGASFFLAWAQGVFGVSWSYEVYPAVMGLAAVAVALGLAGAVAAVTRTRRSTALLVGLSLPLTLNGFAFGMIAGFTPQTYGLVFALVGLLLLGLALEGCCRDRSPKRNFITAGLAGMVLAALIHTYPENGAFVGVGCATACAFGWFRCRAKWFGIMQIAAITVGSAVLLVNLQWVRAYHSVLMESSVVTGWAVPWTIFEFWKHSIGWHSGSGDGFDGLTNWAWLDTSMSLLLIAVAIFGVFVIVRRRSSSVVAFPYLAVLGFLAAGFLYFRYIVPSPFAEPGIGMSWSEYKLSQHASGPFLLVIGCALGYWSRRSRWGFRLVTLWLAFILVAGGYMNYVKANDRTHSLREATGSDKNPFLSYLALRQAVFQNIKPSKLIYLDLLGPQNKSREMMTYFLNEWRVSSDWTDDGYIASWVSPPNRTLPITSADWIVSTYMKPREKVDRLLPWYVFQRPQGGVQLRNVERGYSRENDADSWWHWTNKEIVFTYDVLAAGSGPTRMKLLTQYTPANADTTVTCHIVGQGVDRTETIMMHGPGKFQSQPFTVGPGALTIHFSTERPPQKFGSDPRLMAFLIRNLELLPDWALANGEQSNSKSEDEADEQIVPQLRNVEQGYDREGDATNWWHWTRKEILFVFDVPAAKNSQSQIMVQTQYTPAKGDVKVTCRIIGNGVDRTETILMHAPGVFESQPFSAGPGRLTIHFSTDDPPIKYPHDPRSLIFLIKNLQVMPAFRAR